MSFENSDVDSNFEILIAIVLAIFSDKIVIAVAIAIFWETSDSDWVFLIAIPTLWLYNKKYVLRSSDLLA